VTENIHSIGDQSMKICSIFDYECQREIHFSFATDIEGHKQRFDECECLPSCNSISYEQTVVTSKLEKTEVSIDNATVALEKNELRFYFGSDEYTALRRYGSYDTVTFLSDCGGIR
jgi:hypothetical protein